jgi:hypothetical protein
MAHPYTYIHTVIITANPIGHHVPPMHPMMSGTPVVSVRDTNQQAGQMRISVLAA